MIGQRWNVEDQEIAYRFGCDGHLEAPSFEVWRGVTIGAGTAIVWSWVTQVRVAPYSYDWIDNGGRRSPRVLLQLPPPRVGDAFTTARGRSLGRITAVEPERQLTASIMHTYMSYLLVPKNEHCTRLLLKVVGRVGGPSALALSIGDLVMARKQLLNFKKLAENYAR